eukprot:TRINITY_DN4527_c0_g4_i1.p1 TRINITY_DN4527_c0_g4~~TRINITY_DN4527_c0_g4_i1.p1  ORF type:complete len:1040 (-),score=151.75 TRINITY_DN4527_c0_g4_i1:126-3245(-)
MAHISLAGNQISGTIPSALSNLTFLAGLDLQTNSLSGTLPQGVTSLVCLEGLLLSRLSLSGTISGAIAQLTALERLRLGGNSISGTLPDRLSRLSRLQTLSLRANAISGTIHKQLGRLHQLTLLSLDENPLSGTLPCELSTATALETLLVQQTPVSGTIPSALASLSNLRRLHLDQNRLSGSIPRQLSRLVQLWILLLGQNLLSGTIPSELSALHKLGHLYLGHNSLSGPVPTALSSLTKLQQLHLQRNALTGTIPDELRRMSQLDVLDLSQNSLTGNVPHSLFKLTLLKALYLNQNSISGSIPSLVGNTSTLVTVLLSQNSVSGTFPLGMTKLAALKALGLNGNLISGTLPSEIASLTALHQLFVSGNLISGTLPRVLASMTEIRKLIAHFNLFGGRLPALTRLSNLTELTLFGNWLTGRLNLPAAAKFAVLIAHDNRLSCPIDGDSASVSDRNLLLPGNLFSEPIPRWAQARELSFLYRTSWWQSWGLLVTVCAAGLVGMAAVLLSLHYNGTSTSELWRDIQIPTGEHGANVPANNGDSFPLPLDEEGRQEIACCRPENSAAVIRVRVWCAKRLWVGSITLVPLTITLYCLGSKWYECGKPWLYSTAAYLAEDPALELAVAATTCASAAGASFLVHGLGKLIARVSMDSPAQNSNALANPPGPGPTWPRRTVVWGVWIATSLVLSTPTALYVVGTTLPPNNNTLGLSRAVLEFFQHAAGPMLYGVSALLVPPLARAVAGETNCNGMTTSLILAARFLVTLLVPFVLVVLLNQQCLAFWLRLWQPCHISGHFDVSADLPYRINTTFAGLKLRDPTYRIISHSAVCDPAYRGRGECPRAVVDAIGKLLVDKLLFSACVGPVVAVLRNTAAVRAAREWVAHTLLRQSEYQVTTSLDSEAAGIIMLLELVLVFGCAVPVMIPVAMAGFLLHAIAFEINVKCQEAVLKDPERPPVRYLWFSLLLGTALMGWMFVECGWHGRIVVLVGMPVGAVLGAAAAEFVSRKQATVLPGAECLEEPLLRADCGVEGGAEGTCMAMEGQG